MTRPVTLPPELEAYVEARVAAGDYASVEDAVEAAVDLLRERDEKLVRFRAMIEEAYESLRRGEPTYSVEEALAEFDRVAAEGEKAEDRK
ncbi:MAG TPA: type II toxin-antitoxin system ParD family antitoxin [Caulobacteraceae bacterium]|jgi:antitoxin ParD1/3/4